MRPRAVIYDDLLRFQADLSFDIEQMFFRSSASWQNAERVLDFGAGNGYYAHKLAEKYPDKSFVCVERDPALAERALSWLKPHRAEVIVGSAAEVPDEMRFDFVIVRHAMSYLSNRIGFMKWVKDRTLAKAGVLTVDADDEQFWVKPRMPFLESGNQKFKEQVRASGGDRELRERLRDEWKDVGFSFVRASQLVIHSDIALRKELMYMFMRSVAEYDHGSPLPSDVQHEVDSWIFDPTSYLQYGMFGSLFEKV